MRAIENFEIYDVFTGEPFTVDNPKKAKHQDDKSVPYVIPLTVHHAIRVFLNSAFRGQNTPPSMEESARATRIFTALRRTEVNKSDTIELDDSDYEWFMETFETRGPSVFHINAHAIKCSFREVGDEDDLVGEPICLSKAKKKGKKRKASLVK